LNLADYTDEAIRHRYLTACLLTFYQQLKLYRDKPQEFRPFLIERPLWVFVRGRRKSIASIKRLLAGRSDLLDAKGRKLFEGTFLYLNTLGLTPDRVFD